MIVLVIGAGFAVEVPTGTMAIVIKETPDKVEAPGTTLCVTVTYSIAAPCGGMLVGAAEALRPDTSVTVSVEVLVGRAETVVANGEGGAATTIVEP